MLFAKKVFNIVLCAFSLTLISLTLSCSEQTHIDAIIEYFKDKKENDLTMVLGAGGFEHDYTTRFKDYKFVVDTGETDEQKQLISKKLLKSPTIEQAVEELKDKLKKGQKEPLPIPLNFNSEAFFSFLDNLKGKFKEIIFDSSVTKFVGSIRFNQHSWGLWQINKIFEVLKDGGEFYLDTGFFSGYTVVQANAWTGKFNFQGIDPKSFISLSISDKLVTYIPEYGDISDYQLYADYIILQLMRNPKFDYGYAAGKIKQNCTVNASSKINILKNDTIPESDRLNAAKIYLTQSSFYIRPANGFSLILQGGKDFTAGKYVSKEISANPENGTFRIPSDEFMAEHIVAFLKLTGFEAAYRQNAQYPSPPNSKHWVAYPGDPSRVYTSYTYIYAKKPISLEKSLDQLKDSLAQLKSKLQSLDAKLVTLREALGH